MPRRALPIAVAALTVACFAAWGVTGSWANPPDKKWEQPRWKTGEDQHDDIVDVSVASKQVTIRHVGGKQKVEHTLKVTALSDIKINDQKAALTDLKPGMRVIFSMGVDGESVESLTVVPPPKPPPTPVPTVPPSFPHGSK